MKKTFIFCIALVGSLAACSNNHPASSADPAADSLAAKLERNKAVIMRAERGIETKDVNLVMKDCAPGYIEYGDGQGKPVTDIDSIKKAFHEAMDAFDIKGSDLQAFASGGTVVVTGTWSGTFRKPFMGVQPNGKSFRFQDADIFVLNDEGKILSHRATQTSSELLKQLGLLQPVK